MVEQQQTESQEMPSQQQTMAQTMAPAGGITMKQYIFGARNGIYIIDLQKTVNMARAAFRFVSEVTARGGAVLFVGTKKQAQDTMQEEARRSGQFHVTSRWLGGTLTNFKT